MRLFLNTKFFYILKDKKEVIIFSKLLLYLGINVEKSLFDTKCSVELDDEMLPALIGRNEMVFGRIIVPFTSYSDIAWCIHTIDFILQDPFANNLLSSYRPEFYYYDGKIFYSRPKTLENVIIVDNDTFDLNNIDKLNGSMIGFYSSNPFERLVFIWGLLNLDFDQIYPNGFNNEIDLTDTEKSFAYFAQLEYYIVKVVTQNKMFISFLNILKELDN